MPSAEVRPGVAPALELRRVTKDFGRLRAVSELDFVVPRGSLNGLLGPNGSGKTTTIRMIMGILRPDRGELRVFGNIPSVATTRSIGYLPEERGLYPRMRVSDNLEFLGRIRGLSGADSRQRAHRWLDRFALSDRAGTRLQELSKGMQQKVQFIGTVLHQPDLLILDEPFSGLDPINQDLLEEIVREFHAKGTTILLSTHLMDQAERLCERVCLISNAHKVLDGNLRELKRAESRGIVLVEFDGPERWLDAPDIASVSRASSGVRLELTEGSPPHPVLERAVKAGARVRRFQLVEPRLHEIFVRHVGSHGAQGTAPRSVPRSEREETIHGGGGRG